MSGNLVVATLVEIPVSATLASSTTNNWNPGVSCLFLVTALVPAKVTGIVAPAANGTFIELKNDGANKITLTSGDTGSMAANRIYTPDTFPLYLIPNATVGLKYDASGASGAGWYVIYIYAGQGGGGGGGFFSGPSGPPGVSGPSGAQGPPGSGASGLTSTCTIVTNVACVSGAIVMTTSQFAFVNGCLQSVM